MLLLRRFDGVAVHVQRVIFGGSIDMNECIL